MSKDSDKAIDAIRRALGANPKAAEEWQERRAKDAGTSAQTPAEAT